jgi:transcriptional regulator GlxA family with amidase domain
MAIVENNPGQRWTTESMARQACLSVSRLHALFRHELDTTPATWLSQVRLQLVREWLVQTSRPIAELSLAAGYSDQNAMTRAMRKASGITPAALRRQAIDSA